MRRGNDDHHSRIIEGKKCSSLSQRVSLLIDVFEQTINFLCDQRLRISDRQVSSTNVAVTFATATTPDAAAEEEKDYQQRKRLAEKFIVAVVFKHFDGLILQFVQATQKRYTLILQQYFQSVHDSIETLRLIETAARTTTEKEMSDNSTNNSAERIVEYVKLLFGGNEAVVSFVKCIVSVEDFEESLVPFSEPLVREIGWITWCVKMYTLHCPLDVQMFNLLSQMKREEMYPAIRKKVHDNVSIIKFAISIITRALECHTNPTLIMQKFTSIWPDVYGLALNVLYQWLMTLNDRDIQGVLNQVLRSLSNFKEEVPQMLAQWKQQVLIERENNGSCTCGRRRKRNNNGSNEL